MNGEEKEYLFAQEVLLAEERRRGRVEVRAEQTQQRQRVGRGVAPEEQALAALADFCA